MNPEKEKLVNSIVKGFAYAENGGKPDINNPSAGKSGELKSIFQFTAPTWKADAKEVFGNENAPLTPDNETYVMQHKVSKWIDEGKNVDEMASIHNSGQPNAYKENHRGVNKFGVKYDTPAYAQKVKQYSQQFYKDHSNIDSSGTALNPQPQPISPAPIDTKLNTISDVQKNTQLSPIQDNALKTGMISTSPMSKTELQPKLAGLFNGNVKTKSPKKKKGVLNT